MHKQPSKLREEIRDLGDEIDRQKAKTAAAMGAAVFLLLLAIGGLYDITAKNDSIPNALGISSGAFTFVVVALGVLGLYFLARGIVMQKRSDNGREARLATLQTELADLESDVSGDSSELA